MRWNGFTAHCPRPRSHISALSFLSRSWPNESHTIPAVAAAKVANGSATRGRERRCSLRHGTGDDGSEHAHGYQVERNLPKQPERVRAEQTGAEQARTDLERKLSLRQRAEPWVACHQSVDRPLVGASNEGRRCQQ